MRLDDGTYISFWPNGHPGPLGGIYSGKLHSYDEDFKEYARKADVATPIDGLDEEAIRKWWRELSTDLPWWRNGRNCSDIVGEALQVGGLDVEISWFYESPTSMENEVKHQLDLRRQGLPSRKQILNTIDRLQVEYGIGLK